MRRDHLALAIIAALVFGLWLAVLLAGLDAPRPEPEAPPPTPLPAVPLGPAGDWDRLPGLWQCDTDLNCELLEQWELRVRTSPAHSA